MNVVEIAQYTDTLLHALNDLLPLLTSTPRRLTPEKLQAIIASPTTRLLMAEENGRYLGCLTLAVFQIPSGTRALIEDVVVQEAARGRGVGEALMINAIEMARALGAEAVSLTSHPSRQAANRLYQRLGFEIRDTNVYRRKVPPTLQR